MCLTWYVCVYGENKNNLHFKNMLFLVYKVLLVIFSTFTDPH